MPTADAEANSTPTATRRQGGQPGNNNSRRHGFYARLELTDQQRALLEDASAVTTNDVVDALRIEIYRLISLRDYDPLAALAKALFDGERTVTKLATTDERNEISRAITAVLADVERERTERYGAR